ncbi:MAG TPA: hypothetical protein VL651_13590, partial [Bacteroidia bacterium]|nr:hypothetical protein [Bacteroidia bacterium]
MKRFLLLVLFFATGNQFLNCQSSATIRTATENLICYGPMRDSLIINSHWVDTFDVKGRRIGIDELHDVPERLMGYVYDGTRSMNNYPDSNYSYYYVKYSSLPKGATLSHKKIRSAWNEGCNIIPISLSPKVSGRGLGTTVKWEQWENDTLTNAHFYTIDQNCRVLKDKDSIFNGYNRNSVIYAYKYFTDDKGRTIMAVHYRNDTIPTGDTTRWIYTPSMTVISFFSFPSAIRNEYYD